MTQMLLFDGPTSPAETNLIPVTPAIVGQVEEPADEQNVAKQLEHDSGLHHMGDLARLVLLRYDLVAKRKAAMARRRRTK